MRKLFEKLGSLVLGVGALGLVLAHAAMTHGCASSPATPAAPPGAMPGASVAAPPAKTGVASDNPSADPDCQVPEYMPATKAPVWMMLPPKCREDTGSNTPPQSRGPSLPAAAQQQAP
jgi:hypothetical protein